MNSLCFLKPSHFLGNWNLDLATIIQKLTTGPYSRATKNCHGRWLTFILQYLLTGNSAFTVK